MSLDKAYEDSENPKVQTPKFGRIFREERNILLIGETGRGKTFLVNRIIEFCKTETSKFDVSLDEYKDEESGDFKAGTTKVHKAIIIDRNRGIKYNFFSTIGYGHQNSKSNLNNELLIKLNFVHQIIFVVYDIELKLLAAHYQMISLIKDIVGDNQLNRKKLVTIVWNKTDSVDLDKPLLKKLNAELRCHKHVAIPNLGKKKKGTMKQIKLLRSSIDTIFEVVQNSQKVVILGYENLRKVFMDKICQKNEELSNLMVQNNTFKENIEKFNSDMIKKDDQLGEMKAEIEKLQKDLEMQKKQQQSNLETIEQTTQSNNALTKALDSEKFEKHKISLTCKDLTSSLENTKISLERLKKIENNLHEKIESMKIDVDQKNKRIQQLHEKFVTFNKSLREKFNNYHRVITENEDLQPYYKLNMIPIVSFWTSHYTWKRFQKIKSYVPKFTVEDIKDGVDEETIVGTKISVKLANEDDLTCLLKKII